MLVNAIGTNVYKNNQVNFGSSAESKKQKSVHKGTTSPLTAEKLSSDIKDGLDALGGKKLEIILHNPSAPTQAGKDVGIGSLYSKAAMNTVIPFLKTYGFTSIQKEPEGMRPLHDNSPYAGNSFVYNPMNIDLERLTEDDYGNILDKNVYKTITRVNHGSKNSSNYEAAKVNYETAIDNAWDNFKEKVEAGDPSIEQLAQEFEDYKAQNADALEPYALYYSVLTPMFGNDYYANWPEEYANLYNPKDTDLINELVSDNKDIIDKFIFTDMLAKKAIDSGTEVYTENGIAMEGDNPVGYSHPEVWAHPDAFLTDYRMGCPPDGTYPEGQGWAFPPLDPAKLFNKDGSLGESGKFLYEKCKKLAEDNQGGIRIDHLAGLIDPYVFKGTPIDETAGRLFASPNNPDLKDFAVSANDPKRIEKLGKILKEIVIPACEEGGLSKEDIICENLGMPDYATDVFNKLGLGGMVVTIWQGGLSAKPTDTVMLGSHDNEPFALYVDNLYGPRGKDDFNYALWSAVDNATPHASHDEKQAIFDKYRFDTNRNTPDANKEGFVEQKLTELFTSPAKRVQIFWPDLLGMKERYNTPGTTEGNWKLRMSADALNSYDPKPMIKALANALEAQDDSFVEENQEVIDALNEDLDSLSSSPLKLNLKA